MKKKKLNADAEAICSTYLGMWDLHKQHNSLVIMTILNICPSIAALSNVLFGFYSVIVICKKFFNCSLDAWSFFFPSSLLLSTHHKFVMSPPCGGFQIVLIV